MADATLRINADTRQAERALGSLQQSLKGLVSAAALGGLTAGFVRLADAATNLQNKLNQVSSSNGIAAQRFQEIVKISNEARAPLEQVGDLYFRIARSADSLNLSNQQVAEVTRLVSLAITSSGISAQEAAGPLLQLGQALQAGTFQGDELRSVLEGLPPVARALADSLGVPVGALKTLGAQGRISGKDVTDAILRARDSIERDFGRTTLTVGQAITVLTNNFTNFIDKLNQSTGATNSITKAIGYVAAAINFLGDNIEYVILFFEILITVFITRGLGTIAKALFGLRKEVTAIAFVFKDATKVVGSFINYIVAGWRSMLTQIRGTKQAIAGPFDQLFRIIFVPISYLIGVAASFFRNFAVPVGIAVAYITGLLDTMLSKFSGVFDVAKRIVNTITGVVGVEVFPQGNQVSASENQRELAKLKQAQDERLAQLEEQRKKNEQISAAQFKFNEELQRSLRTQELDNQQLAMKGLYLEENIAAYRAIAEQQLRAQQSGAKLTPELERQVAELARSRVLLEQMAQGIQRYRELTQRGIEQGLNAKYFEEIKALQEAFNFGRIQGEMELQEALLQLTREYELAKYEAAVAYEDKKWNYRQMMLQRELQAQGFTLEQAKTIATERVTFERKSEMEKTQFAIQQGAELFNALGQYNRQAFQAAKAFNIANAIMNTYTGATKALATYPPPFNFIAAAAVVASGLAQVATIRSQQFSGRAIGGPVAQGSAYIVGENGPEIFQPQGNGRIIANNQLDGGGSTNINFNITTTDARGFDQLLAERKPMIVNMVRTAMNDRGNKANL